MGFNLGFKGLNSTHFMTFWFTTKYSRT